MPQSWGKWEAQKPMTTKTKGPEKRQPNKRENFQEKTTVLQSNTTHKATTTKNKL